MDTLTVAALESVLASIRGRRIGLVGDLFLDRYLDIDAARDEPSVETGLTAYQVTGVRNYPGALGTVLNNLVALGVGQLVPIAIVGDDGEGYDLLRALRARPGVVVDDVVVTRDRMTPTYTKPMYGSAGGVRELNRLDIKNRTPTSETLQDELLARLSAVWLKFDAVVVLDQVSEAECGVVTARVRERVAELAAGTPETFVLADSRERIGLFRNVCVKPNERETAGFDAGLDEREAGGKSVFVTLGEKGIRLLQPGVEPVHVPAYPVTGPVDICGAGDSCSAGIAVAKACGLSDVQAAMLGNLVASVTVRQIGVTGTCTPAQLLARWQEVAAGVTSLSPSSS